MIFRASIEYFDGASEGTLRLATQDLYDSSDNFYEGRLSEPVNLRRTLYKPGRTSGVSSMGVGVIEAINDDGGLDHLKGYGFDGRTVTIEAAESVTGTWDTILVGTVEQVEVTWNNATFRLRDPLAFLDVPVQPNVFAEGQEDIDGKPIPLALGAPQNVTPVRLDQDGSLVFQVHDGPVQAIPQVCDDGNPLGQNMVTNGDFSDEGQFWLPSDNDFSNWMWEFHDGKAYFPNGIYPGDKFLRQQILGLNQGGTYVFSADVVCTTGAHTIDLMLYGGSSDNPRFEGSGTFSHVFTISQPVESTKAFLLFYPWSGWEGTLDNISLKPVVTDHPTRADLEAATVPAGGYHTCLAEGLFRLGSNPSGTITCDVTGARNLTGNVLDGYLDAGTGWTLGTGWSVADGEASHAAGADSYVVYNGLYPVAAGTRFLLTWDIADSTAGTVRPQFSGRQGDAVGGNGGHEFESTTVNTSGNFAFYASADFDGTVRAKMWIVQETAPTSVATIMSLLLLSKGILPESRIDSASITALAALNGSQVGIYITAENRKVISVLDELAASIGAWWHMGRAANKFTVGGFEIPASGEVVSLDVEDDCLDISRIATMDQGRGVPAWKIVLHFSKNYTVQVAKSVWDVSNVAGIVSEERRAFISQEWRTATASDEDVKGVHLLAPELEVDSLLTSSTAAATEVARLLAIYSGNRDRFQVRVPMSAISQPGSGVLVDLGDAVFLTWDRFGLAGGRYFVVIGMTETYGDDLETVELDLYG